MDEDRAKPETATANFLGRSPVVARPTFGTPRFRRNCWLAAIDGALVANDRKNRRFEFALAGSDGAPHSHRLLSRWPEPSEHHFIDGSGHSVVVITNGSDWDVEDETAVAQAAGLVFDCTQTAPPLRDDCVKLEDSSWAELRNVQWALAAAVVIFALGKFEVLDLIPWAFVAVALLAYCMAGLFSGRYFASGRRRGELPASPSRKRNTRTQRKQRTRRRG